MESSVDIRQEFERQRGVIIMSFDFDWVVKIMTLMNWKYFDTNGVPPDEARLIKTVSNLLEHAFLAVKSGGAGFTSVNLSSGGFLVQAIRSEDGIQYYAYFTPVEAAGKIYD